MPPGGAGDWAELEVDTKQLEASGLGHAVVRKWVGQRIAVGSLLVSGVPVPTCFPVLTYLTSYEGMGKANVSCVSGCTCKPAQVDALWPGIKSSLFAVLELGVSGFRSWHRLRGPWQWAVKHSWCLILLLCHPPLALGLCPLRLANLHSQPP